MMLSVFVDEVQICADSTGSAQHHQQQTATGELTEMAHSCAAVLTRPVAVQGGAQCLSCRGERNGPAGSDCTQMWARSHSSQLC